MRGLHKEELMARWIRIETPDWNCTVRGGCDTPAEWEEDRTKEQIAKRELPALRCERHLPSDADKIEPEPEQEAV